MRREVNKRTVNQKIRILRDFGVSVDNNVISLLKGAASLAELDRISRTFILRRLESI